MYFLGVQQMCTLLKLTWFRDSILFFRQETLLHFAFIHPYVLRYRQTAKKTLCNTVSTFIISTPMKYQDFSSDENLVSSEDTIFIFHTVKISLPDFLDQLFTHFKGQ